MLPDCHHTEILECALLGFHLTKFLKLMEHFSCHASVMQIKNIINIDRFFDSGVDANGGTGTTKAAQKQPESKQEEAPKATGVAQKLKAAQSFVQKEEPAQGKAGSSHEEKAKKEDAKAEETSTKEASTEDAETPKAPSNEEIKLKKEAARQRKEILKKKKAALQAHR